VPALFWFNALLIASNGTDSRVGSLTADWERFFEWKRIAREDEPRRVSLEVMLRGTVRPGAPAGPCGELHAVLRAQGRAGQGAGAEPSVSGRQQRHRGPCSRPASEGHGRGGVFWQTQGSGKSFSMVFFAQKVLRRLPGNWSFVVVTDRVELDDQIAKTFKPPAAPSNRGRPTAMPAERRRTCASCWPATTAMSSR
jgi:type I restriction enzyme R subunit